VATNKGNVNKKENQLQQKTGVDCTLEMLGFVPYGKLKKASHHDAIKEELVHRGVSLQEEGSTWNYSDYRKKLKEHEINRLQGSVHKAMALKGFQPQSTADFRIS
jgi:hypothetical protein